MQSAEVDPLKARMLSKKLSCRSLTLIFSVAFRDLVVPLARRFCSTAKGLTHHSSLITDYSSFIIHHSIFYILHSTFYIRYSTVSGPNAVNRLIRSLLSGFYLHILLGNCTLRKVPACGKGLFDKNQISTRSPDQERRS